MLEALRGFTEGFQEIRINADKNDALYRHFTDVADRLEVEDVTVGGQRVMLLMFSNAFLYGLLGVITLVLPVYYEGYTDIIYKVATAAMFCVSPITTLASANHLLNRAEIGLAHVHRLEPQLDADGVGRKGRVRRRPVHDDRSVDRPAQTLGDDRQPARGAADLYLRRIGGGSGCPFPRGLLHRDPAAV